MKTLSTTRLVRILGAIVSVGPRSIDMYLPTPTGVTTIFSVDESIAQLTLVAFLSGSLLAD